MRFPPTMPLYSGMLVDADENLWVSRYAYLPGPRTWDVFDASGQLLGEVRMPRYFFPRQITNSEIIGSSRDAMEIERVKVYRIRKGAGDRGGWELHRSGCERRGGDPVAISCLYVRGPRDESTNIVRNG